MSYRTFFTADTHFNHRGIIEISDRPFKTIEQMNDKMIQNWNQAVQPRDTVWFLGDFAFGSTEEAHKIFEKLNGIKHLIVGNHDKESVRKWNWASVSDQKTIDIDGQKIFLNHYPVLEWPAYFRGAIHLFGHVHGNRQVPGLACDVGVDVWGYRPVQLSDIMPRLDRGQGKKPETVNDRLSGHARQLLDIADRSFEPWEKDLLARAIEEAVAHTGNEIIEQRILQAGGR